MAFRNPIQYATDSEARAAAAAAQTAADNAQTAADNAQTAAVAARAAADQALADAADAQASADGKVTSYFQTTAPTGLGADDVGDLWFDTDDANKLHRWTGSAWSLSADTRISDALTAAGNAQATADGKIVTLYQAAAPSSTGRAVGDLWVDTDDANRLHRWSGSAWVAVDLLGRELRTAESGARVIVRQTTDASGFSRGAVLMYGASSDLDPAEFAVVSYDSLTGKKWAQLHAGDASDLTGTRPGISYGVQDAAAGGDEAVLSFQADRAWIENGAGALAPVAVGSPVASDDAVPKWLLDTRVPLRVGYFDMEPWTAAGWNVGAEGGMGLYVGGIFYLQGGFAKASSWAAGDLIATLHTDHRPARTFTFAADVAGAATTVKVYASGSVRVQRSGTTGQLVTIYSANWPLG